MVGLMEVQMEIIRKYEKFRREYKKYMKIIKRICKEVFGNNFLKLFVFGSLIEGNVHPLSDIDVAIVLRKSAFDEERMEFYKRISEEIGPFHPFEFHIISKEEWEEWYKRFVGKFEEI